jgi:hypothetical protein
MEDFKEFKVSSSLSRVVGKFNDSSNWMRPSKNCKYSRSVFVAEEHLQDPNMPCRVNCILDGTVWATIIRAHLLLGAFLD